MKPPRGIKYDVCECCEGSGCLICNGNGWYGHIEPQTDTRVVNVRFQHGNKKVSDYDISEMHRLYYKERKTQKEIAKMYDLSYQYVSLLITTWEKKHEGE